LGLNINFISIIEQEGGIIKIMGNNLILPEGMKVENYGEIATKKNKQKTSTRVQSLKPAIEELAALENEVQQSWIRSRSKYK